MQLFEAHVFTYCEFTIPQIERIQLDWNKYNKPAEIEYEPTETPNKFKIKSYFLDGLFSQSCIEEVGFDKFSIKGVSKFVHKEDLDLPSIAREATPSFNKVVNVIVPCNELLGFTRVKNVNDYCTDMLQDELANGWHILAICVQPDQRRPDYILGKKSYD